MPESARRTRPPAPAPGGGGDDEGEGPSTPKVEKPNTDDLLERMRKVDPESGTALSPANWRMKSPSAPQPRMDGDFLSLLPEHPLSRVLTSDSQALAGHQIEATTVLAFHYRQGVLMAGDHRATADNLIFSDRVDKILPLDSDSLMGHRWLSRRRLGNGTHTRNELRVLPKEPAANHELASEDPRTLTTA